MDKTMCCHAHLCNESSDCVTYPCLNVNLWSFGLIATSLLSSWLLVFGERVKKYSVVLMNIAITVIGLR